MFAVFEDRNQQFRVQAGDRVLIPLQADLEAGESVTFDKVCLITDGEDAGGARIGTPYVDGAKVTARVLGERKGPKLYIQKFRRRKNSRSRSGFRARYTEIEIQAIDV